LIEGEDETAMRKPPLFIFILLLVNVRCHYLSLDPETGNPLDHPPVITAMTDTAVKINDTVTLHAEASDPNGTVESFEWAISAGDDWHSTGKGEYAIQWGISDTGAQIIRVRAVDNEGVKSAVDSVMVTVNLCAPLLNGVAGMTVKQHDTASFTLSASDTNAGGIVKKYYYKTGPGGWIDSSDRGTAFRLANPDGGPVKVVWGARDNDGVLVIDSFTVLFNRIPGSPSMTTPLNGAEAAWASTDVAKGTGSVSLAFSASDPDGEALTCTLFLGMDTANLVRVYQGQGASFTASSLDTTATYHWRLTATDPAGQTATATGTFLTGTIDPVSGEGLTAYYPFSGNAKDKSGNGYDGTVHGAALTQDRFGTGSAAYSFNGTGDYIDCGVVNPVTGNHFTLSVWICFTDTVSTFVINDWYGSTVIMKGNQAGKSGSYGINIANYVQGEPITFENTAAWFHVNPNAGTTSYTVGSQKGIFSPHRWYHLVCTLNGNTLKLFVDGECVATSSMSGALTASDLPLAIGRKGSDAHHFFKGRIDDIRIYDRALADQEIQALFHEGGYIPPLDIPVLAFADADSTSISVKWNKITRATVYVLESAPMETGPFSPVYSGADTGFIYTGLSTDQQVWYRVKATNTTQSSGWSTVISGTRAVFSSGTLNLCINKLISCPLNENTTTTKEEASEMLRFMGASEVYSVESTSVSAMYGDTEFTVWWNTYNKANCYGIRYGNVCHSYWGSNATYFEICK